MALRKVIVLVLSILLVGSIIYSDFSVRSQESLPVPAHFWLVTNSDINNAAGPLIDRYLVDIGPKLQTQYPGVVVEKKIIDPQNNLSIDQQSLHIATTLENGFHENHLIGSFIIGLPIPRILKDGKELRSMLPYGDFDNKFYIFSQADQRFVHMDNGSDKNIHPEILLGYLPDLGTTGLTNYFNAHHNYVATETSYNKAIFFNDQLNDEKLWQNLDQAIGTPTSTQPFNPQNYQNALASIKRSWQEALVGTHRWQAGTSVASSDVRTYFDSWYNEPALSTLQNILPAVGSYFLDFPSTNDTEQLATEENTMGEYLSNIGAFSSPIAIRNRFFNKDFLADDANVVCTTASPFPAIDSDNFRDFRNQFNTLEAWIRSIPRGSLLAEAPNETSILLNAAPVGKYFVIRPGSFVNSATGEPVTLKTILVDPSAIRKELVIPRTGFTHPGVTDAEVPSWNTIEITNDQTNELISWHYFLSTNQQYQYFTKNRLPPLNQYLASADTYEISFNVLSPKFVNLLEDNCLENRSAETRSLVTIFGGHIEMNSNLATTLAGQELASGKSLAAIVLSSTDISATLGFDQLASNPFSGLKDPALLTSFASGDMLAKSILSGFNENVNLLGDPCLTLGQ